jgi:DNA-binding CsgD family transcriptional regulator
MKKNERVTLSVTEWKTCVLLMRDYSIADISVMRNMSHHTIIGHNKSIRTKTKCANIYAAVLLVYRQGVITEDDILNAVID